MTFPAKLLSDGGRFGEVTHNEAQLCNNSLPESLLGQKLSGVSSLGSASQAWDNMWETMILSEFEPSSLFDGIDPMFDIEGMGESWSNIQQWADLSFQPEPIPNVAIQDIVEETIAAGGQHFCCFGMIPDIRIKLVGDMAYLRGKLDLTTIYQSFAVTSHSEYFMLKYPDNDIFAQVSALASKGLEAIDDIRSVEIRAYVETKQLLHIFTHAKKPGEATLKVEINIYGSMDVADIVGVRLSSAKIFLQDPEHGMQACDYHNPHVIQFTGIEETAPSHTITGHTTETTISQPSKAVREERERFDDSISRIYDSLTRYRNLDSIQAGSNIITPLLPHQEKALAFMKERESGPVSQKFSLWNREHGVMTTIYRHKLTGTEVSEEPNELGGGILADDMGMGKTLSTLALISLSLGQAKEWSQDGLAPSRRTRTRATLIIVPSTLIMNSWMKEMEIHLDKTITVVKYYGKGRDDSFDVYQNYDIVFTTYHTIAASMNRLESTALSIAWFRVVLDEAHMIRRRETTLFQAASQLSARFRWCLTGTPIQNHLEDAGSLLAFLRVNELENKSAFKNHIVIPFADDVARASNNFAILLDSICLRRPQELLHLPQISEEHHYITLSPEERRQYDETLTRMRALICEKANSETTKRNPFGIFQAQLQLRLLCNHGTFQKQFTTRSRLDRKEEREDFLYVLGKNAELICSMCGIPIPVFDAVGDTRAYNHACGHKLCQDCAVQNQDSGDQILSHCPLCDTVIPPSSDQSGYGADQEVEGDKDGYFNPTGHSSKIDDLMQDIERTMLNGKSIVFSCWTRTLDLVASHLRERRIPFQRIDGNQVLWQRQYNMDRFVSDKPIRYPILLMSTGVGAFGLNLTAANRVYILEPQWNPSVESQAIGRVSRLGQQKPVSVIRYLVRGTVEVNMHSQQIRKLELAKVGFRDTETT